MKQPPVILTQPAYDTLVPVHDTVTLTVRASGDQLSYLWYEGIGLPGNEHPLPDQTSSTITLTNPGYPDYHVLCTVTNPYGSVSSDYSLIDNKIVYDEQGNKYVLVKKEGLTFIVPEEEFYRQLT